MTIPTQAEDLVLVPREPTREMLDRAQQDAAHHDTARRGYGFRDTWLSMISAVPSIEGGEGDSSSCADRSSPQMANPTQSPFDVCEHRWFVHPTITHALACPRCGGAMLMQRATEVSIIGYGAWDASSFHRTGGPRLAPSTEAQPLRAVGEAEAKELRAWPYCFYDGHTSEGRLETLARLFEQSKNNNQHGRVSVADPLLAAQDVRSLLDLNRKLVEGLRPARSLVSIMLASPFWKAAIDPVRAEVEEVNAAICEAFSSISGGEAAGEDGP